MPKKITPIIPEFIPLRGLCEDVNRFLTLNNGNPPDLKMKISPPRAQDDLPIEEEDKEIIDVTKLIVRMNNYIAMVESASRDLLETGSPERLLAVRAAREKEAPRTGNLIIPSSKLIN